MAHYALLWDDPNTYDPDQLAASQGRPVTYGWWGTSPRRRPGTGDIAWVVVVDADGYPMIAARANVERDVHGEVWISLGDMLVRERMVPAHWLRQEHYDEIEPDRRTAWSLSEEVGRALEDLWQRERTGQRLRQRMTWYLENSSETPSAGLRALKPTEIPVLGSWGGRHEVSYAWLYTRNNGRLGMIVAVFSNYSNHDILCVVGEPSTLTCGVLPHTGPTLQLNGRELYESDEFGTVHVTHHGLVTVRSRVSRSDLLSAIRTAAPREADHLELRSLAAWPFRIGNTADPGALLDSLFEYGYCVEQAKRHLRGDLLLSGSAVDPDDPPRLSSPVAGQGRDPDDGVRRLVENHAMSVADTELTRMGFSVERVSHQRGALDLLCTNRAKPTMILRVEVKGTRGDGSTVLLTAGEVMRARAEPDSTALFVVSQIQIMSSDEAVGGKWRIYRPWQLDRCELYPTQYRCHLENLPPDEYGDVRRIDGEPIQTDTRSGEPEDR